MPPDAKRRPGGNRTALDDLRGKAIDSSIPSPSTMVPLVEALDRVVAALVAQRHELARIAGSLDVIAGRL